MMIERVRCDCELPACTHFKTGSEMRCTTEILPIQKEWCLTCHCYICGICVIRHLDLEHQVVWCCKEGRNAYIKRKHKLCAVCGIKLCNNHVIAKGPFWNRQHYCKDHADQRG